jgi:hypothetical protein
VYRADPEAANLFDLFAVATDGSRAPIRLNPPDSLSRSVPSFELDRAGLRVAFVSQFAGGCSSPP